MSYSTEKEFFASPTGQLATKFISENPGCTFTCTSDYNNHNFKMWHPLRDEHLEKWCNNIYKISTDELKTYNDSIPETFRNLIKPIDISFHRDYVLPCDLTTQSLLCHTSIRRARALSDFYERTIDSIRNHKFAVQQKKDEIEAKEKREKEKKEHEEKVRREEYQKILIQKAEKAKKKKEQEEREQLHMKLQKISIRQQLLVKEEEEANAMITNSINNIRKNIAYYFSDDELNAIIALYAPLKSIYTDKIKNTLLALQAVNRFARDQYIRVEDAEKVLKEFIK